jgi:hypothetical protein
MATQPRHRRSKRDTKTRADIPRWLEAISAVLTALVGLVTLLLRSLGKI